MTELVARNGYLRVDDFIPYVGVNYEYFGSRIDLEPCLSGINILYLGIVKSYP